MPAGCVREGHCPLGSGLHHGAVGAGKTDGGRRVGNGALTRESRQGCHPKEGKHMLYGN